LAEVTAVDEVMAIRDEAAALAAAARIANNHQAEADAVALRMRATRRLGQLMQAQKESVGFATGGEHGGRRRIDGSRADPSIIRPTLAMQGIDKHLAHHARMLSAASEEDFEALVADAHDKVARAVRNAVREIEIKQRREAYAAKVEQGGTVTDLTASAASGFRAGVIYVDPPWAVWPELPGALDVIAAWGFQYQTAGFVWVKQNASGDLFTGMGYHTRANTEPCLLATRGSPQRLSKDVHQVVIAPVGEHSEKPDEVYCRIERLYPGPYLELFARKPREHWTTWGDEIAAYDANADFAGSLNDCYRAIRARKAQGGKGWEPR
jgi:N6-adenosine-specific RNA methylase IME4